MDNNQEKEIKQSECSPECLCGSEQKSECKKKFEITVTKKGVIIACAILALAIISVFVYRCKSLVVAATVNGEPISRLSVIRDLEKSSGKQALDSLINQKLIADEAKKKGISVGDDEMNVEIKKMEDQVKSQGQTLDEALKAHGMTIEDFKKQIITQKELEKLLGDKAQVSDEDVAKYIVDNKVTIPSGQEETYKSQIKNEIQQQKLSDEASKLIDLLRSQGAVKYFVNY